MRNYPHGLLQMSIVNLIDIESQPLESIACSLVIFVDFWNRFKSHYKCTKLLVCLTRHTIIGDVYVL